MKRRQFLLAAGALAALPRLALSAAEARRAIIGAAWRGPHKSDPYFAGALVADWETRKLEIRYAVPLPTRPHGLLTEADGGLLVVGVRPGTWLLRCDGKGEVMRQLRVDEEGTTARLNGHVVVAAKSDVLYTTETDQKTGRGKIGVRDRQSLRKLAEFDTHGIDPHQLLLDREGHLIVANGGVPRTPADKKLDLHRMDSSLVRLDAGNGTLLRQWRLDDPRLSMRHLAWSRSPIDGDADAILGIAIQAEHDDAARRAGAPILAVLDGEQLLVPTRANDGIGYAGDIAAAYNGGFALSSNQAGLAQLWHPGAPEKMAALVRMEEAYALASWNGPGKGGGVLVATALGLVRAHPTAGPVAIPWPKPMALDNHWVLLDES
jgi:hypothetical protein